MRHITARTALALLAAAALSACGAEPGADPSGDATTEPETTAAEPTEAEPTGPVAADGADYAACEDGACEVAVAEPVDIEVGDALPFSVTAVTDEGIEFFIVDGGASVGGSVNGICEIRAVGTSFQSQCPGDVSELDDEPAAGELLVQLLGIDADGAAVLRFTLG
ncbi:MAG: hypothetical protein HOQ43_01290 [Glycomyces artemisiae]|uniref:Lipoprotein n=1 Tax=Glycomyces artemisiae TaxID=1076443 RepID=A0A850BYV5_9ACTN|nr:hypothetical protein [Glycomyces artemisiae]